MRNRVATQEKVTTAVLDGRSDMVVRTERQRGAQLSRRLRHEGRRPAGLPGGCDRAGRAPDLLAGPLEAGEEYRLLGVNSLDEFALSTPAIAGDRLLIRTQSRLYSIRNRR
jgi:hypothetical protein